MSERDPRFQLYEQEVAQERARRLQLIGQLQWCAQHVAKVEDQLQRTRARKLWRIGRLLSDAKREWWRWLRLPVDAIRVLTNRAVVDPEELSAPKHSRPPQRFDLVAIALTPHDLVPDRWRLVRPPVASKRLGLILNKDDLEAETWPTRKTLARYLVPELSELGSDPDEQARLLLQGQFRPSPAFDWIPMDLPPEWHSSAIPGRTWDFYKHSLQWLHPLLNRGFEQGDKQAGDLVVAVIDSWMSANTTPPGASEGAWYDHSVALRLRLFSRFWDLYRRSSNVDQDFAGVFLATVYQHAIYACDPENYNERSNHGLEIVLSLVAAAASFPEFQEADSWLDLAFERLEGYVETAFSEEGINKEQSPSYHFFILQRLAHLVEFLAANGVEVPRSVKRTLDNGIAGGRHILRPDYSLPRFGDSTGVLNKNWRSDLSELAGLATAPSAPDYVENPRSDAASLFVSFSAGYAIFSSTRPETANTQDLHLAFKCNYFNYPHYHRDGGSFILYAGGRDWVVDAGTFGMDWERPERQYVRSARAHNVVTIDNEDFDDWPMELRSIERSEEGDTVKVCHYLGAATHTRSVTFAPPERVIVRDQIQLESDEPAVFRGLLHLAPDLDVELVGDTSAVMRDKRNGNMCAVSYSGEGELSVILGEELPELQGWHSPERGVLVPAPVLVWEYSGSQANWKTELKVTQSS